MTVTPIPASAQQLTLAAVRRSGLRAAVDADLARSGGQRVAPPGRAGEARMTAAHLRALLLLRRGDRRDEDADLRDGGVDIDDAQADLAGQARVAGCQAAGASSGGGHAWVARKSNVVWQACRRADRSSIRSRSTSRSTRSRKRSLGRSTGRSLTACSFCATWKRSGRQAIDRGPVSLKSCRLIASRYSGSSAPCSGAEISRRTVAHARV
jgi:hypothetical protein